MCCGIRICLYETVEILIIRDFFLKSSGICDRHPAAQDIKDFPVILFGAGGKPADIKVAGLTFQFPCGCIELFTLLLQQFGNGILQFCQLFFCLLQLSG